jgi:hypothetical protein
VKYFIISIDGKKYNVTALKDKEMTRYTVNNLDPSTTYGFYNTKDNSQINI